MMRCAWLFLFVMLWPSGLSAQEDKPKFEGLLNKLLAPGPLMAGHDELEHKDCLKCHEPAGGIPNAKCTDCHKEIRAHVEARDHYHGLMKGKACIDCHKDHKGRMYDAVSVNQKNFDHGKTGYDLTGAHSKIECAECHLEKRKGRAVRPTDPRYFGTKDSCIGCHKSDDIHYFKDALRNKECGACHTTEKWKPSKGFDHAKESGGYQLLGAHSKLKCDKCHVKQGPTAVRYDWPLKSKQCLSCHKDHHGDKLSPRFRNGKCDVCHAQDTWKLQL